MILAYHLKLKEGNTCRRVQISQFVRFILKESYIFGTLGYLLLFFTITTYFFYIFQNGGIMALSSGKVVKRCQP